MKSRVSYLILKYSKTHQIKTCVFGPYPLGFLNRHWDQLIFLVAVRRRKGMCNIYLDLNFLKCVLGSIWWSALVNICSDVGYALTRRQAITWKNTEQVSFRYMTSPATKEVIIMGMSVITLPTHTPTYSFPTAGYLWIILGFSEVAYNINIELYKYDHSIDLR